MKRIAGNYEILSVLGEGGMGTVYYAVHVALKRYSALKSLRPELASRPEVVSRFQSEAQTQARLNSPYIAQLYEYFQDRDEFFMAMEFVDGPTLSSVLRQRQRIPWGEASRWIIEALQGLEHAHRNMIIHRDVKPANLMLTRDKHVKVTDFGIARVLGAERATKIGSIIGTFEYISPEAVQGNDTSELSDLYSTGVVLFELLSGRLPFASTNEYELARMHVETPPPPLRRLVPEVPRDVEAVVLRAMAKNPRQRFRSAGEMGGALQACLDSAQHRQVEGTMSRWRLSLFGGGGPQTGIVPTDIPVRGQPDAGVLLEEKRRSAVSTVTRRVDELLNEHRWQEALRVVESSLREYPGEPYFVELRTRIERDHKLYDENVKKAIDDGREFLKKGLVDAALSSLEWSTQRYPREPALQDLLREARRQDELRKQQSQEVSGVETRVNELVAAGQFQEAVDAILDAVARLPSVPEFNSLLTRTLQLRKDQERRAKISEIVDLAGQQAATMAWHEALDTIAAGLRKFPQEAALLELQARTRQESDVAGALDTASHQAQTSLQDARATLAAALALYPAEERLSERLAAIDAAIEEQRRKEKRSEAAACARTLLDQRLWAEAVNRLDAAIASEGADRVLSDLREVAAAKLKAHQAQVQRAVAHARKLLDASSWEEAIVYLTAATRDFPGESVLADFLQQAQLALAARWRQQQIREITARADALLAKKEFDEAVRVLIEAVSQYPDEPALNTQLGNAIHAQREHAVQTAVAAAKESAEHFCAEGDLGAALATLDRGIEQYPADQSLRNLRARYRAELDERRKRQRIAALDLSAPKLMEQCDFVAALASIDEALRDYPAESRLVELRASVETARRAAEVKSGVAEARLRATKYQESNAWQEALAVLDEALHRYPEASRELTAFRQEVAGRRVEFERLRRRSQTLRDITEFLEAGRLDEAAEILGRARAEFGDDSALQELGRRMSRISQQRLREQAVLAALDAARVALAADDFARARTVLAEAEKQTGPEPRFTSLLQRIEVGEGDRARAIAAAHQQIGTLLAQHDWRGALEALDRVIARFPEEREFRDLRAGVEADRKAEARRRQIASNADQIEVLLEGRNYADAGVLLRVARQDFLGEEVFEKLGARLEEAQHAESLERQWREAEPCILAARNGRNWASAIDELAKFGEDPVTAERARALTAEIEAEWAAFEEENERVREEARGMVAARKYAEACEFLNRRLALAPEAVLLRELLVQSQQQHSRLEELERHWNEARERSGRARQERDWNAALESVAHFRGEEATAQRATDLIAEIEAERTAFEAETDRIRRDARQLIDAGKYSEAAQLIENRLSVAPGAAELAQQLAEARQQMKRVANLEASWQEALGRIAAARQAREWNRASEILQPFHAEPVTRDRTATLAVEIEKERSAFEAETEQIRRRARNLISADKYDEAARILQERLSVAPNAAELADLLAAARQQLERIVTLERSWREALEQIGEARRLRDWERASGIIQPFRSERITAERADSLAAETKKERSAFEAENERVRRRARELIGSARYDEAARILDERLSAAPGTSELTALLAEARQQIEHIANVEASWREALEQIGEARRLREWDRATAIVQPFHVEETTAARAGSLAAEIAKERAAFEAENDRVLRAARQLLDAKKDEQAIGLLANRLDVAHGATQLRELLDEAEQRVQRARELERQWNEAQTRVESARRAGDWTLALETMRPFRDDQLTAARAKRLAEELEQERVQFDVANEKTRRSARKLIDSGKHAEAVAMLEARIAVAPVASVLGALLAEAHAQLLRAQELEHAWQDAQARAEAAGAAKNWDAALDAITAFHRDHPADLRPERLAAQIRKQRADFEAETERICQQAWQLIETRQYRGAIELLQKRAAADPGNAAARDLLEKAQDFLARAEEWEQRWQEACVRVARERAAKNWTVAIEALSPFQEDAATAASAHALAEQIGQERAACEAEAEKARLATEAAPVEALERRWRDCLEQVQSARGGHRWRAALAALDPFRADVHTADRAARLAEDIEEERKAFEAANEHARQEAKALLQAGDPARAIELLQTRIAAAPEVEPLSALLAGAQRQLADWKRAERLSEIQRTADTLVQSGRLAEARDHVQSALSEFAREIRLTALLDEIAAAVERRDRIATAVGEIRALIARGQGTGAERALVEALRAFPDEAELVQLRSPVDEARQAEWKRSAIQAGVEAARLDLRAGDLDRARERLARLSAEHGDDPSVLALLDEIERASGEAAAAVGPAEKIEVPPPVAAGAVAAPIAPAPPTRLEAPRAEAGLGETPPAVVPSRRMLWIGVAAAAILAIGLGWFAFGRGGAANGLKIEPAALNSRIAGPSAPTLTLRVSGVSGSYAASPDRPWLRADPPSGALPREIGVRIQTSLLSAGSNSATLTITSGSAAAKVPVRIDYQKPAAAIRLSVENVSVTHQNLSPPPKPRTIDVQGTNGAVPFAARVELGRDWLSVTSSSPTTPARIELTFHVMNQRVGTHQGSVVITPENREEESITLPVTLVIRAFE